MKRMICNQCRKEESPDHYGGAPRGWYNLLRVGHHDGVYSDMHLCSSTCLVTWSQARANEDWEKRQPITEEAVPATGPGGVDEVIGG